MILIQTFLDQEDYMEKMKKEDEKAREYTAKIFTADEA